MKNKKNKNGKTQQSINDLKDKFKWPDIHVIKVSEEILEETIVSNISIKSNETQTQET